jgi:hypothetical protein
MEGDWALYVKKGITSPPSSIRSERTPFMVAPIDILRSVRIRQRRLTYLPHRALWDLALEVRRVDRENVPGSILEAGTALGGSAIMMALTKSAQRPLQVFDVFGMIPFSLSAAAENGVKSSGCCMPIVGSPPLLSRLHSICIRGDFPRKPHLR